ncbi:hypothetical protein [Hymenobacter volaticus]|uniref:Uncharacterized protein n=1 Tax=Hymenobacter volaticus TaxID=2932254 RepID=A0ABY4G552_9BACT|nr:hypothetical protein [Hymenobacter volaticus]UOQ66025.1 hypothetical protein MUN86_21335 [Hymenobacter volaticus]
MPIVVFDLQDYNSISVPAADSAQLDPGEVFRIGEFLIGDSDCSNLGGHPDIRY